MQIRSGATTISLETKDMIDNQRSLFYKIKNDKHKYKTGN